MPTLDIYGGQLKLMLERSDSCCVHEWAALEQESPSEQVHIQVHSWVAPTDSSLRQFGSVLDTR